MKAINNNILLLGLIAFVSAIFLSTLTIDSDKSVESYHRSKSGKSGKGSKGGKSSKYGKSSKKKKAKKKKAKKTPKTYSPTTSPQPTYEPSPSPTNEPTVTPPPFDLAVCSTYEEKWDLDLDNTCYPYGKNFAGCQCEDAEKRIDSGELSCEDVSCPDDCEPCKVCLYYVTDCLTRTDAPVGTPTRSPKPTLSKKPTPSPQTQSPTRSSAPTSLPSFPPSPAPTIDCDVNDDGSFGTTDAPKLSVSYRYDLEFNFTQMQRSSVNMRAMMDDIDTRIATKMASGLFLECAQDTDNRRMLHSDIQRKLNSFDKVVGVKVESSDIDSSKTCAEQQDTLGTCVVVGGEASLFLKGVLDSREENAMDDDLIALLSGFADELDSNFYDVKAFDKSPGILITTDDYYPPINETDLDDIMDDDYYGSSTLSSGRKSLSGLEVGMIAMGSCVAIAFGLLFHSKYSNPRRAGSQLPSDDNLADYSVDRGNDMEDAQQEDMDLMHGKIISVIDESKPMNENPFSVGSFQHRISAARLMFNDSAANSKDGSDSSPKTNAETSSMNSVGGKYKGGHSRNTLFSDVSVLSKDNMTITMKNGNSPTRSARSDASVLSNGRISVSQHSRNDASVASNSRLNAARSLILGGTSDIGDDGSVGMFKVSSKTDLKAELKKKSDTGSKTGSKTKPIVETNDETED